MELGPIASRVKMLVDGVYRAQRYGRNFRVPQHELLALVQEVDALEKQNTTKPDNHEPRVREKAEVVGGASDRKDEELSCVSGSPSLPPPPTKKETLALKNKEQK